MKLCSKSCLPNCDSCLYAIHECWLDEKTREIVVGWPIGCNLHIEKYYQELAESCSYCKDFYCFQARD